MDNMTMHVLLMSMGECLKLIFEGERNIDLEFKIVNEYSVRVNKYRLKILDHNNEPSSSTPVPNVVPIGDKTYTLLLKLELLFSSIYEEYFNEGHKGVSKSSALSDNLQQQDTQPRLIVQPTLELIIPPTDVNVEKNNTDQAEDTEFKAYNLSILLLHQEQKIPSPSHATLIL
ncbi:hypothetical protein Tco_0318421 [Tanacetum coccineum]